MMKSAERVGHGCPGSSHPQSAGFMMGGPDLVSGHVELVDIGWIPSHRTRERFGRFLHFTPGQIVGVRRIEIDPGARTAGARIVLPGEIHPALSGIPGLRVRMSDHLPDGS